MRAEQRSSIKFPERTDHINMAGKILATVNGIPISEEEVNSFINSIGEAGRQYDSPEGRKRILEQLISRRLFLLDAQRNLLEAEPAFQARLKAAKEDLLADYAVDKLLSSVTVSEEEMRKYYDDNADKLVTPEMADAAHILVATEAEAEKVLAEIKSGAISFADAARKYSSCPSKASGGELGKFARGQMVKEFEDAAFSMKPGEISGPVKTQFGYHIIKLNSITPPQKLSYQDIRSEIRNSVLLGKRNKAFESKVNMLKILYPVDMF